MATKAEFLVNKVEVLVALVTVSVAISSPVSRKAYLMNKPSCEETLGREDQHCRNVLSYEGTSKRRG